MCTKATRPEEIVCKTTFRLPAGLSLLLVAVAAWGWQGLSLRPASGSRPIDRVGATRLLAMVGDGADAFRAGHYDSAAEIFERVLDGLPDARSATTAGALLDVGSGTEYLRLLSSLNGNLGLSHLRARRYEQAIGALEKAVSLSPRTMQPRINLGLALFHAKRFREASRSFERALTLGTGDAKLHLDLGRASLGAGNLKKARWALTQAVRLAGRDASVSAWGTGIEAEKLLAEVELRERRAVEAERLLRSILQRVPGEVQTRYRLIQTLERTERMEEAALQRRRFEADSELLGAIQAALVSDADGIQALLWVADSYRQLGLLHLAEVHYRQLLARNPRDTQAVLALHDLKVRKARTSLAAAQRASAS